MTPQQQQQIDEATARAKVLDDKGHNEGSIEFTLRQEGFAEAVIKTATGELA